MEIHFRKLTIYVNKLVLGIMDRINDTKKKKEELHGSVVFCVDHIMSKILIKTAVSD